jgi:hypothetical protein
MFDTVIMVLENWVARTCKALLQFRQGKCYSHDGYRASSFSVHKIINLLRLHLGLPQCVAKVEFASPFTHYIEAAPDLLTFQESQQLIYKAESDQNNYCCTSRRPKYFWLHIILCSSSSLDQE